jgi:hypothetical protein
LWLALAYLAVALACGSTTSGTVPSATLPVSTPTTTALVMRRLVAADNLPPELQSQARAWAEQHGLTFTVGPASDASDGLQYIVSLQDVAWTEEAALADAGVRGVVVDPSAPVSSRLVSVVAPDAHSWLEAGFLAGAATGLMGDIRAVGWIGGDGDGEASLAEGFDQGIRYACPRCLIVQQDADSLDTAELVRQGVAAVLVAPGPKAESTAAAAGEAGLWVVWIGEAPQGATLDRWVVRVVMNPAPLLLSALDALEAGEDGQNWPYSVQTDSLTIVDVRSEAISPGRQRLLQLALGKLASGELQLETP